MQDEKELYKKWLRESPEVKALVEALIFCEPQWTHDISPSGQEGFKKIKKALSQYREAIKK